MNLKGVGEMDLIWSMLTIIHNSKNEIKHFNLIHDWLDRLYGTDGLYEDKTKKFTISFAKRLNDDAYAFLCNELAKAVKIHYIKEQRSRSESIRRRNSKAKTKIRRTKTSASLEDRLLPIVWDSSRRHAAESLSKNGSYLRHHNHSPAQSI